MDFFTFILCNFTVQMIQYFQKNFELIFCPWKHKKWASKVAHNRPQTFFSQVRPGCPIQLKIDFSYYEYVPRLICFLICGSALNKHSQKKWCVILFIPRVVEMITSQWHSYYICNNTQCRNVWVGLIWPDTFCKKQINRCQPKHFYLICALHCAYVEIRAFGKK